MASTVASGVERVEQAAKGSPGTPDDKLVTEFLATRAEKPFLELYRRHTPVLYRVAWRFLRGDDDGARDVVQETWLRAGQSMGRFRGGSSVRSWLVAIAINRCRETLRARARVSPDALPSSTSVGPGAHVERIDLERAVSCLADGYREVIVLHDVEGFTHRQIAGLLGIEEGTSKSQLARARRALRAALGGAEPER